MPGLEDARNGERTLIANSFSYFADGKIEKLKLGNQLWEKAKLNSRLQATEIAVGYSAGDGSVAKFSYEYGELSQDGNSVNTAQNAGNIAKQTVTFAGQTAPFVQTYRYDSLDRLKEVTEKMNGVQSWRQTFGYDLYGNRTSFSQVVGSNDLPINSITLPGVNQSTNRFTGGQGYTYDANGNIVQDVDPLSGHTRSFTFNGDNKQTQVTDTTTSQVKGTYFYDGGGNRVKKVTADETTVFVYDGLGKLVAEYSTATPPGSPTIHYTATDQLGSPRVITNGSGAVESRRDFMPFGEELYADGTYRKTSDKYSTTGEDAVRQRFTGYEKDKETGLDFAQARYYQNQHGRFTAIDPLLSSGNSADPQTFNRYVYVMNNPVVMVDRSGLFGDYYDRNLKYIGSDGKPDGKYWYADVHHSEITEGGNLRTTYVTNPVEFFLPSAEPSAERAGLGALLGGFHQGLNDIQTGSSIGLQNVPSVLWNTATTAAFVPFASVRSGHDGLPELFIPNPFLVQGFQYANERQARWGQQVTAAALAAPGAAAAPFGASSSLSIAPKLSQVSSRSASSTALADTGSYVHRFESGKFYAGKGSERRMARTGNFISRTYNDPLVSSEFFPATSNRAGFMNEHRLMMSNGGPLKFDSLSPTYNKIFSPGRKIF